MGISRILLLLINAAFTVIGLILGLRIILRFFGANPNTPFVDWLYDTSDTLLAPFAGIFPTPRFEGFVIDFPALFALIIYALIGYVIIEIVEVLTLRSEERLHRKR